jgi:pimeloyl-ACP methyl ester carboxylesterase
LSSLRSASPAAASRRPLGPRILRLTLGATAWTLIALGLGGCQSLPTTAPQALGVELDRAIQGLAATQGDERARAQAAAQYRRLTAAHLSRLLQDALDHPLVPLGGPDGGIESPRGFAQIEPVERPRLTRPELHRSGIGLPLVGRIADTDPNTPWSGYRVPLTLVALPGDPPSDCCRAALADPTKIGTVRTPHGDLPLAMDLETPLALTSVTGPRLGAGIANLLRPGRFIGRPRIVFLQPFDPDRVPVVLVHGLMSTPHMWEPLIKDLLTDPEIRDRCQFWFFYYPTGQPVPLSALQLREALDAAVKAHDVKQPMILIGHSMGGILSRAQVSRLTPEEAEKVLPGVSALAESSPVRRALIFQPRGDVSRVVFLFTPHRGSRLASSGLGALGIRLIRLPNTLLTELGIGTETLPLALLGPRLPTSIHGLSPQSAFLRALDRSRPTVPAHSVIGDRGRGDGLAGSDGVVPYLSAHLPSAESELVVPTGHGGIAHPETVAELKRIIRLSLAEGGKARPPR